MHFGYVQFIPPGHVQSGQPTVRYVQGADKGKEEQLEVRSKRTRRSPKESKKVILTLKNIVSPFSLFWIEPIALLELYGPRAKDCGPL